MTARPLSSLLLKVALRETMRVQDGRVPLLARHLARLKSGGCPESVLAAAADSVRDAARRWAEPYGRMTLLVGTDGTIEVETSGKPSTIDVPGGPLIAVVECVAPPLPPGAAKPADRSPWDKPLGVAQRLGADVAVLVSPEGLIIDTSQATIWLFLDGVLVTPPSPPALAGVSRGVVLDAAEALGIHAEEGEITLADLANADEVILTTAVAGARAVRERGGAVAEKLSAAFDTLFGSKA
ncbi:MAG: aminotransferase class IV [Coriobacteriia bacterium]|nr:aminotransferase class IV [Coriobacteriia bacterium]